MDYVIISAVQASGVKGVLNSPTETILPNLKIHSGLFEACAKNNVKKLYGLVVQVFIKNL